MPNKRKDNKGRLLRTGESQRKDLTYMYRYTDMRGKRQCVYADDLNKLREKEKKIQLDTLQGLDISGGGITVLELVIVNCAIITVLCNHYLHMKIYYLNKELKKLQSKEETNPCH